MPQSEAKKRSRKELLELLVTQGKKIEALQAELDKANAELETRAVKINKAGTMAEAALMLNGVYEAVDAAARQYLENIKLAAARAQSGEAQRSNETAGRQAEAILDDARKKAEDIVAEAQSKASAIVSAAEQGRAKEIAEIQAYVNGVNRKLREYFEKYPGLEEYMTRTEDNDK